MGIERRRERDAIDSAAHDIRVLGPIEAYVDGQLIDIGGSKPRALLAALVVNRNRVVSSETLIDGIWGESAPATVRKSLQKMVWALRKQLGDTIETRGSGYSLNIEDSQVDAGRLESAVEHAQAGRSGWEQEVEDSLMQWRGDPLPELADTEWGLPETGRLSELRLEAEELLSESWITTGDLQRAIALLEEQTSRHPYRERLWALLMTALYASGRQAEALAAFKNLRKRLGEELGIAPSHEIVELEERILMQDPDLALAVKRRTPSNLPAPITSFIGRIDEMKQLSDMLTKRTRLISLVGPAGSGKTRLAIELGRWKLDEFVTDGVWFIDLAPVNSPDQVVNAIAAALGVGQFSGRPTEEVVSDYLAHKKLLLILDNCEHVVQRVAVVADSLLAASQDLVLIATSRERIGIMGEVILDVLPLPYPSVSEAVSDEFDAVRLFVERSREVAMAQEVSADDPVVGEIVRRLDGIPLALELAAARVRSLGLEGLRKRLDDRFAVLKSPDRGVLPRHETLQAAVDWSYQLLSPDEQTLFSRLSVFRGGFDFESATAVCGYEPLTPSEIVDLLTELVDKSHVSVTPSEANRRFSLLESLREYGQTALLVSDRAHLRQNHLTYFRDLAERAAEHFHGPEQAEWLAVLRSEHDNLNRALRWGFDASQEDGVRLAVALGGFWDTIGSRTEGNSWLARAVEASQHLDPRLHVDALLEAASVASSVKASIPLSYAERAVELAQGIDDERRHAQALRALCWALAVGERPEEAIEAGTKALHIFEKLGDPWETALCQERLGQGSYEQPEWAVEMLTKALRAYQELGDRIREALALQKIADRLAHSLGDLEKALDYASRSVAISKAIGSTHDEGHARLEYGKVLRRAGDLESATAELRLALAATTKAGDERCTIRALTALGTTLIQAGSITEARDFLTEAVRRGAELGETHTIRAAIAGLARAHADAGHPDIATILFGFVERLSSELDIPVSDKALSDRTTERSDLRRIVGNSYDDLWKRGSAMSLPDAVALALSR